MPCHRFSAHHSFFSPACAVCRVVYKYTHIVTQPNGTTRHSTQKKITKNPETRNGVHEEGEILFYIHEKREGARQN